MDPLAIARDLRLPDLLAARARTRRHGGWGPLGDAAASRAVKEAFAVAASRSPVLDVCARIDRLAEIVLGPDVLTGDAREGIVSEATALADRVASTWVAGFSYVDVDRAVALLDGGPRPVLAPPATDATLFFAPIASTELVERAASRLAEVGFAAARAALEDLAVRHERAEAARPRRGPVSWILPSFDAGDAVARMEEATAREALLVSFEEVELLRFESLAGFPPMRLYVAAAAVAGVARDQRHLAEPRVTDEGRIADVPSRLAHACIGAAVQRLLEARDELFPRLSELLRTGRSVGIDDGPYRRAVAPAASDKPPSGWLPRAFDESGVFALLRRAGAHGSLTWDANLERDADRLNAEVELSPRERVAWHRERLERTSRDLSHALAHATRRDTGLAVREHYVAVTRLCNGMTVINERPFGIDEANAAAAQMLWMLQHTIGPFSTRAGFGWLVAQELQYPGAILRSASLPSDALGDHVRRTVKEVALALASTDFMDRWNHAFSYERDAAQADVDAETARAEITLFDRINIFTESRAEAVERMAKKALGVARAEIVRAGRELAEIVEHALEVHATAHLVVSFHDVLARLRDVRAVHPGGDRRYLVLEGDAMAKEALTAWGRRAFRAFGPFPTDGELLDGVIRERLGILVDG